MKRVRVTNHNQYHPLGAAVDEPHYNHDHSHYDMRKSQMRILLVRHGESEANVNKTLYTTFSDHAIKLSEAGRLEATATGQRLKQFFEENPGCGARNRRILVSPYIRAIETAERIVEATGDDMFRDWKERTLLSEQQFGLFEGIPTGMIDLQLPREYAFYDKAVQDNGRFWAKMPMGESRYDVSLRMITLINELLRDEVAYGICDVVLVSHGVTLRAFAMEWLEKTPEWMDEEPNPENGSIRLFEGTLDKGYL
jgi:broad specificity phosphatase PhoE